MGVGFWASGWQTTRSSSARTTYRAFRRFRPPSTTYFADSLNSVMPEGPDPELEVSHALRAADRGRIDDPHGRCMVVAGYRHTAWQLHDRTDILGHNGRSLSGRWRIARPRGVSPEQAPLRVGEDSPPLPHAG